MQNAIYFSNSFDPYENLALEDVLFSTPAQGCTFYLWQNQNTVVIGKHQNAWKECRISLLEQEGGRLARRSSGGGAVFHDLGNINFTFVMPREAYDVTRQLGVICKACAQFGIRAEYSGRNDILVDGAKFSGNAFRFSGEAAMHHGTVLISADMQKLSRYLAPPPDKLASKGVDSVRARVVNLSELNPDVTVDGMKRALVDAFIQVYGPSRLGQPAALDAAALNAAREKFASWAWRLGSTPGFDITLERRFAFGNVELQLSLKSGYIAALNVYSDAMDEAFIDAIAPALRGVVFRSADMGARVRGLGGEMAAEIAAWIEEKGF